MVALAVRATPQEYFNRQPSVQSIQEPVTIQQAPPPPVYIVMPQQDNTKLIIVGGIIIIGVVGIVAIVASCVGRR